MIIKTQPNTIFETEVCGRCGGTGNYSYNQIDGTRCFGCGGTGWRYTKRGSAARKFWLASLPKVNASDVVVGMRIKCTAGKFTVAKISHTLAPGYSNNGYVELESAPLNDGSGTIGYHCPPDAVIDIVPTEDQRLASLAAAKAYQETLTKAGTVRK